MTSSPKCQALVAIKFEYDCHELEDEFEISKLRPAFSVKFLLAPLEMVNVQPLSHNICYEA